MSANAVRHGLTVVRALVEVVVATPQSALDQFQRRLGRSDP